MAQPLYKGSHRVEHTTAAFIKYVSDTGTFQVMSAIPIFNPYLRADQYMCVGDKKVLLMRK